MPLVAPLEIAMQSRSCHIASSDERRSGHRFWHFKTNTYLMIFIYLDRPMQNLHHLWVVSTNSATLGPPGWIQNAHFSIGLEIIPKLSKAHPRFRNLLVKDSSQILFPAFSPSIFLDPYHPPHNSHTTSPPQNGSFSACLRLRRRRFRNHPRSRLGATSPRGTRKTSEDSCCRSRNPTASPWPTRVVSAGLTGRDG